MTKFHKNAQPVDTNSEIIVQAEVYLPKIMGVHFGATLLRFLVKQFSGQNCRWNASVVVVENHV